MDSLTKVKTEVNTEYSNPEEVLDGLQNVWSCEADNALISKTFEDYKANLKLDLEISDIKNIAEAGTSDINHQINSKVTFNEGIEGITINSERFECQFCNCSLNSEENKNKHEIYCSKRSKEMDRFYAAKKTTFELQTLKTLACDECDFKTNKNLYLKRHKKSMHRNEQHCCNLCDFKTAHRSSLVKHRHTHNQIGRFLCKFCTKSFHQKQVLDAHLFTHHKNEVKEHIEILTNKIHRCTYCSYETVKSSNLILHVGTHGRDSDTKRFICYHCEYVTYQKSHLVRHMNSHLDVRHYACGSCGRAFRRKELLDCHILSMHREDLELLSTISHKINQCPQCTFVCIKKSKLNEHIRIHDKK